MDEEVDVVKVDDEEEIVRAWPPEPVSVRTVRPVSDFMQSDDLLKVTDLDFFGMAGDESPLLPESVGCDSTFANIDMDKRSSSSIARFMTPSMHSVVIKLSAFPGKFPVSPARMPVAELEDNFQICESFPLFH